MKCIRLCITFRKLSIPFCAEINGRSQGKDGLRIHRQFRGLFFQKSTSLLIHPLLKCLIISGRSHFSPEGGCIIIFCQRIQSILLKFDLIVHPQRICENAGYGTVITVICIPGCRRLLMKRVYIIAIKQVQNLASAITIGHLRQHGKSHININRRTSFVFSTGFTEQL